MKKILLVVALCVATQGQTKPELHRLNPAASKAFTDIGAQQQEVARRANEALQQLEQQKAALLIGGGVDPADLAKTECKPEGAIVVCVVKLESAKDIPIPSPPKERKP